MLKAISPELVLFPDFWVSSIPRYFSFLLTQLILCEFADSDHTAITFANTFHHDLDWFAGGKLGNSHTSEDAGHQQHWRHVLRYPDTWIFFERGCVWQRDRELLPDWWSMFDRIQHEYRCKKESCCNIYSRYSRWVRFITYTKHPLPSLVSKYTRMFSLLLFLTVRN